MAGLNAVFETFSDSLFSGKTVLVSGATSGIGLDIARGYSALGAQVIASGTNPEKIARARGDAANESLRFEELDVRDMVAVEKLAKGLPELDVLVNAAGTIGGTKEHEVPTFMDVMDVNLNGAMRLSYAFREHLKASNGAIINIASMLSYLAEPEIPAYTASKTAILGLTRSLALAYGPDGIRVNAISPGYHQTDMTKPLWSVPKSHDTVAEHSALKRWGTTFDLVGAAMFLASPAAGFITGVDIPVDGGYVIANVVR